MENKKPPKPEQSGRFAEVTRRAREERAKKPRQVPDEQRPNPYKIDVPNEPDAIETEPLKEKEG